MSRSFSDDRVDTKNFNSTFCHQCEKYTGAPANISNAGSITVDDCFKKLLQV